MVFGTRPEAIKMIPLFLELQKENSKLETKICVTAQHRNMLDQVLEFFDVSPDYDLDLMRPNQNLYQLTSDIIVNMKGVLEEYKPDLVLVHGDTTTSMAVSIAAFYFGCKIGHVEAGLRTFNRYAPFPEEMNRNLTAKLSNFHFAPTEISKNNLINEGIDDCLSDDYEYSEPDSDEEDPDYKDDGDDDDGDDDDDDDEFEIIDSDENELYNDENNY